MPRRTNSQTIALCLQLLVGRLGSSGGSQANATIALICSGVNVYLLNPTE
jgi:hypothetical protein